MTTRAHRGALRQPERAPDRGRVPSLRINAAGIAAGARQVPSPNADARPRGTKITLLVVHNLSLPPGVFGGEDVVRLFTNTLDCSSHLAYEPLRTLRVSAHFFVRRTGEVVQFVSCRRRAWHAGESAWDGRSRCNDFSIGIELEGSDTVPYADVQYDRLADLVIALRRRYPIADLVGHSDVAPARKTDPGPAFDWPRLRALVSALRRG